MEKKILQRKHLSPIANHLLQRCAEKLEGSSVKKVVEEFEAEWRPEAGDYSRKLVEFCGSRILKVETSGNIEEKVMGGSFSRITFDMMLAWENPSSPHEDDDESRMASVTTEECIAKEKEDLRKIPAEGAQVQDVDDEIPLFYSDLMPLLVNDEPTVGEDAFFWLASLIPLAADVVNGRFTFETLTAPTGNRLHFPAYDKLLKEIDQCIKHLQKQSKPNGVELADDEFILHVEGTASTQRVVRHIGGTSWPGRLTLTNYALYFEASGVFIYEDAFKIDLSKNIDHTVKPVATGPWGAPLFDKAIIYESPELPDEGVVLEFPEITSSTRRDHWLALTKEVMSMHQFLSNFKVEDPMQAWEMHARTILGIIRLHAAREMLRISPPAPTRFLIFALCDEIPKGDFVLEELAQSLKRSNTGHPCSAASILRSMNTSEPSVVLSSTEEKEEIKEISKTSLPVHDDTQDSLEAAIDQARTEAKEIGEAKAAAEGLKDEGISTNALILMELLMKPIRYLFPLVQEVLTWERPARTVAVFAVTLLIVYREWIGKAISGSLLLVVAMMFYARRTRLHRQFNEIVVYTGSDQPTYTRENIVSAQYGFITIQEMVKEANLAILKLHSIFVSRAPKHADMVMLGISAVAIFLAVIPFKFVIMAGLLYCMFVTAKLGKQSRNDKGERRIKEWWDSIPITPVRIVDEDPSASPK